MYVYIEVFMSFLVHKVSSRSTQRNPVSKKKKKKKKKKKERKKERKKEGILTITTITTNKKAVETISGPSPPQVRM